MPARRHDSERLIIGTPTHTERTAPMPTQRQYDAACDLLIAANKSIVRLKDENARLLKAMHTMQKKQPRLVDIYKTFDAPDTLGGVVDRQRDLGQRPRGNSDGA